MPPRFIDERRIKHEESLATGSNQQSTRDDLPQFTLRGLLVFSTAVAVCLSLVVTAARVETDTELGGMILLGLAAILTWSVLFVTYRRLHLKSIFKLHCFGAGATGGAMALLLPLPLLLAVACGAALGSILSFPVFVLTMVALVVKGAIRRPHSREQPPIESDEPAQFIEQSRDHLSGVRRKDGQP